VDVSSYIRDAFSPQQLYDRIMRDKGGQAIDVFHYLKEHARARTVTHHNIDLEGSFEYLAKYGAGLVTKFHVDDEFRDSDECSFTGSVEVDTSKTSGHAMVLVGVREDKSGQCWLLLQKWWEGKQFVEMTLEYLRSSNAVLYFTADRHTKSCEPLNVSTTDHLYTEADIDDSGDEER
jgi:hypothetical protein